MPAPTTALSDSTALFAALGDPTRMALVIELGEQGPSTASALAVGRPITRQAIGKQLAVLATAGIVVGRRTGREQIWAVDPVVLKAAGSRLEAASTAWDSALERLRSFVED
ncbi:ArsR/SmtB family transcription factor [Naasia lichenicola]|uniref:Winged helix-turn-helix transcriptional regulator n=1 Tax=Naasia lichenicola TaxID=2565933 RepID=A0A4V3WTV1_9MICO|nr:helix-turn-helix domain-containing protein [Naasia lichenicola]THG33317.1 winged helix-turn-helix transcriptional regulator [Naasia lichenicola]